MSETVIKAEGLGKKYTIGHQVEKGGYTALRDVLMQNARAFWNKTKDLARGKPVIIGDSVEEFWALKDLNFEIRRGEAVGIIGSNGAGKSTLLKLLSRITEPSAGRVMIKGKVASLLEVGTGFHPELTGRENIFLNGAIMGMTRREIRSRFDEIVAFAEIEKFLDTPVKRYSSGMYVRLAFAVAAHLEPETLLVDEVLAVGDMAFQKKCLGKMGDVAKKGRTVLFVSHNMGMIRQLCKKGILLRNGFLEQSGNIADVVASYLHDNIDVGNIATFKDDNLNYPIFIKSAAILDEKNEPNMFFQMGESIKFRVTLQRKEKVAPLFLAVNIKTSGGELITNTQSQDAEFVFNSSKEEETIDIVIGDISYYPDKYYVTLVLKTPAQRFIKKHDCLMFEVTQGTKLTERKLITAHGRYFVKSSWAHSQRRN